MRQCRKLSSQEKDFVIIVTSYILSDLLWLTSTIKRVTVRRPGRRLSEDIAAVWHSLTLKWQP